MKKYTEVKKLFSKKYYRILDVGGSDSTYELLKKKFPDSKIFSINPDKNVLPEGGSSIIAIGEAIPFKDNFFDLLLVCEVLEHILYPDYFLKEAKRILKKEGEIIITTPNLNSWSNRILLLFGYAPINYTPYPRKVYGIPLFSKMEFRYDHPRVFPYRTLKKIFNSNGFKLEKIIAINQTDRGRKFWWFRKLVEFLLPNSWKEDIIIKTKVFK